MENQEEFKDLDELLKSIFANAGHGQIKNVEQSSNPQKSGLDIASSRGLLSVSFQDGTKLNLFLKIKRSGSDAEKFEEKLHIHERELLMYSTLIPMLTKYQEEMGKGVSVPLAGLFPVFYGSGYVDKDHYLVFEDILTDTAMIVTGQEEFHTEKQVKTCLKNLGAFHAVSYCYKSHKKIDYLGKYPILQDVLFLEENKKFLESNFDLIGIFQKQLNILESVRVEACKKNPLLSSEIKRICPKEVIMSLLDASKVMHEYFNKKIFPPEEPFALLTHGDFHMWNIAFGGGEQSVKFFDLQVSRYTSAMVDVHHYLVQTTTPETRARCLEDFLSAYLEGFHRSCHELGITENLPEKSQIWEEYKRLSPWGLLMGINWILYRFITDHNSFAAVDRELQAEPVNRDTEKIVELMDKSGPKIWWAIQVLFDLVVEMQNLGTIELLVSFKQT